MFNIIYNDIKHSIMEFHNDNMTDISIEEKINKIRKSMDENNYIYVDLKNEDDVNDIYNLYFPETKKVNEMQALYYGTYYDINKKRVAAKKYYLIAIEYGNSYAMTRLAYIYQNESDDINAEKYYLMAVNCDNQYAMARFADYFYKKGNFEEMKKYYLMAIEKHNNTTSMFNIALCFEQNNDTENMIKYYKMASEQGCIRSIINIGKHYQKNSDYSNMKKYYFMILDHKNNDYDSFAINDLIAHCRSNNDIQCLTELHKYIHLFKTKQTFAETIIKLINKNVYSDELFELICNFDITGIENIPETFVVIKKILSEKIDFMKLHFDYAPNNNGFENAKKDFFNRLSKK